MFSAELESVTVPTKNNAAKQIGCNEMESLFLSFSFYNSILINKSFPIIV